jgi:fused signal recognition particle receptor
MPIVLAILIGAVLLAVVPIAAGRRRRRRPEFEPPAPPAQAPPGPAVEVDPGLAAGIEAAFGLDVAPPEAEPAAAEAKVPGLPGVELAPLVRPRFRDRLTKARGLLAGYVGSILSHSIDDQTWVELEEALVRADVGIALATELLDDLRARVKSESIITPEALIDALKADLKAAFATTDRALRLDPGTTNVWIVVGVNGVGKTTTIGKLGYREQAAGRKVVMAAGDTFRAGAADQLELWSKRSGADLVRGAEGGDPASVIFDAIQRAGSRHADVVLADTAGRLHTKVNLMEELKKVRRVAERPPGNVTEVLLVIDATTGQNGVVQAKQFAEAVGVTGVVLTKLDGTAKGGIALAIQRELGIPIKLVGLGETADDLVEFDPDEFVEALLSR